MISVSDRRLSLTQALLPRIERLLKSDFMVQLNEQKVPPADLLRTFQQYRHYCSRFPKFLSLLLARVDLAVARKPLVENLWEESGEGNIENSHLQLLDRFLDSLTRRLQSDGSLIGTLAAGPAVTNFVDGIERYLWNQPIASAFGFIGPGTEEVTAQQYSIFLAGLKKYKIVPEADLVFFASHIEADVRHANLFWDALEVICKTEEDWNHVRIGAEASLDLELVFWKELVGEL